MKKRKQDIFSCEENYDNFLLHQFKNHGIQNLFGDPINQWEDNLMKEKQSNETELLPPLSKKEKEEQYTRPLELVDTKITTHHVGNKTFFVLTGFKKGMQMESGNYA